jgi:hypothetical protein
VNLHLSLKSLEDKQVSLKKRDISMVRLHHSNNLFSVHAIFTYQKTSKPMLVIVAWCPMLVSLQSKPLIITNQFVEQHISLVWQLFILTV